MLAGQVQMAIEAGTLFLDMAWGHQDASAEPMHEQVEHAQPLDLNKEPPVLAVNPDDLQGVFAWCMEHLEPAMEAQNAQMFVPCSPWPTAWGTWINSLR